MEQQHLVPWTDDQRTRIGLADAGRWLISLNEKRSGSVVDAARLFVQTWTHTLATPLVKAALDRSDLLVKAGPSGLPSTQSVADLKLPNFLDPLIEQMQRTTVLQKIPGLVKAPLNTPIPYFSGAPSMEWVAQGGPNPVSVPPVGTVTLPIAKAGTIVVLPDELVRVSSQAEMIISAYLVNASAAFVDDAFLNPAHAAVADKNPASITNGLTPVAGADVNAKIAAL